MASSGQTPDFLNPDEKTTREPRSVLPWIIAGILVLLVLGIFLARGHHEPPANPGGAALAPADPYAANLAISNLQMGEASNVAGGQAAYVNGTIAHKADKQG